MRLKYCTSRGSNEDIPDLPMIFVKEDIAVAQF
jgi:hypothetical protein